MSEANTCSSQIGMEEVWGSVRPPLLNTAAAKDYNIERKDYKIASWTPFWSRIAIGIARSASEPKIQSSVEVADALSHTCGRNRDARSGGKNLSDKLRDGM